MKYITENKINCKFQGTVYIDKTRNPNSAMLLEQIKLNKLFKSPLTPAVLYNYYISVCSIYSYNLMDDTKVGRQVGYSARNVADTRRKLAKAGWIHFEVFTHKGVEYGKWYIGEDVVRLYRDSGEPSLKDQLKAGIITEEQYKLDEALVAVDMPY